MARNTVVVSITGNVKGLQKSLGQASSGLSKMGKAVGAVSLAAGVAFGAIGVSAFKAIAEIERLNAQTEAAIKSTGGAAQRSLEQLNAQSDALERLTGTEAEVIQGAQNMLLTFTQIKGDNFDKATAAALDLSVALGQDMKSSSVLVGKALNDPIKGIGALSRVGVQLTEDQKALVKQMVATGDVAGAQGVILGVLNEQFGGSAEAFGGTFLGALEKVKNSFGTLSEALVGGLLPAATAGLNVLNDLFLRIADSPTFGAIIEGINGFVSALFGMSKAGKPFDWSVIINSLIAGRELLFNAAMQAFPAILQALITAIPTIVNGLVSMVSQLLTALVAAAPTILAGAVTLFQGLLNGLIQVVPTLINAVVTLLPQIVSTVVTFIPALLNAAVQVFTSLVNALPKILPKLIQAIVTLLPRIITTVLGMIPKLLQAAIKLFTSLINALPKILPQLLNGIIQLAPKIITSVISMIPQILTAAIDLFTALIKAIPKIVPDLLKAIIGMLPQIIGAIIGMVPELLNAGVQLVQGLINGILSMGSALIDAIGGLVGGAIDWAKGLLGIKSPSRVFMGIGKYVGQGFVKGVTGTYDKVKSTMAGMVEKVRSSFDRLGEDRKKALSKLASLNKRYSDIEQKIQDTYAQKDSAARARRLRDLYQDRNEIAGLIRDQQSLVTKYDRAIQGGKREKDLLRQVAASNKRLAALSKQREAIAKKLEEARKNLTELTDARLGVVNDIRASVVALGNLGKATNAVDMVSNLKAQIDATKRFQATLAQLKAMGLDDTSRDQLLQSFLSDGSTAAADALLAGGASAVREVANLQKELAAQGKALGTTIGDDMYAAGIQAAEGLVKGLEKKASSIDKIADNLATRLVKTVKTNLGIKSPSRVFRALGQYTVQGLAKGIDATRGVAVKSVDKLSSAVVNGYDAKLSAQPLQGPNGGAIRAQGGNTYNVTFQSTFAPTAEDGRKVMEAMRRYEQSGGRL